jgi:Putative adhesin
MPHWTVDVPTSLDFDAVTALRVRLIAGTVAVMATGGRPSVVVSDISGRPLRVDFEDGTLTIAYDYEKLSWERLLDWLKPLHDTVAVTVTVPADCPVQLGVVSASAVVCGLGSGASVKGVSGEITLDGVTGDVHAETVSGALEGRDVDGAVRFKSVSGDLTLADSSLTQLVADDVSGHVSADVALAGEGAMRVSTISGDVTVRLPTESDAAVRLHSATGNVRSEFDSLRPATPYWSHTVSGNVGEGSGKVSVNSVSGAVTLLRRPGRRTTPRTEAPRAGAGMESETR